jgi:hypothetical protein
VTTGDEFPDGPVALRGLVSGDGSIRAGTGFALTRTGVGTYTIGFPVPYDEAPVVLVSPSSPGHVATAATSAVGADVTLTNLMGRHADTGFGFSVEPLA